MPRLAVTQVEGQKREEEVGSRKWEMQVDWRLGTQDIELEALDDEGNRATRGKARAESRGHGPGEGSWGPVLTNTEGSSCVSSI